MCSWKSVVKQCNSELQELLNLNCLTAALYAEGLLTDQERQELANESPVPCKQNSHFIQKILPFKGEQSFKKFLRVLENDSQHSGHKELYDRLVRCYTRTRVHSSTPGSENNSEHINVTNRQLKMVIGDLIKEAVRDQVKEVIALQKRHEEQEVNRHKALMNLINRLFNQHRNNSGLDAEEDQRRISTVSNTTSFSVGSAIGSTYSADCEESDTMSIHSGDYSSLAEDIKTVSSTPVSPADDEHLQFPRVISGRPRASSLTSSITVKEHRSHSRSYSYINVNYGSNELLKPPSNSRVPRQDQGHTHSSSLSRKGLNSKIRENQSPQRRGPSSLSQEFMTHNSHKMSQDESISSSKLPESISVVASTNVDSVDSCNASMTFCDHKQSEEADSPVSDTINTGPSMVTLNIQSASDDDDDNNNDKEELDTTVIDMSDKGSLDMKESTSSSLCSNPNVTKLPSIHSSNQNQPSTVTFPDLPMKKHIPVTCQFTIGDPRKQQQVYCQEKDGVVYFISWMDKQVRSRRISRLGAHNDTVITYDPGTDTLSPKQFICRRANMTYAFGILSFKNRIVLVAGDNPKFLDGSVYLYQLVECNKYQRAFSYKWSEMAKSVRSCSPVVASPTHAVCTTTDDCIMVCQLTNNSDYTLKALSINIYNETSTEEDTKWKVMSLNLPTTLLHENGHLTSGTVHQKNLYLSIKTGQGFGVMQVNTANLEHSETSTGLVTAFYNIMEEPLAQYSLFSYCDKLFASSVSKHASSSCSIGLVTFTDTSVKQTSSNIHKFPFESVQLHSIISVPNSAMLILVYYNPHLQSYVLNSVSSVF